MQGYKTYLTAAAAIAYGVLGFTLGYQDANTAMGFIFGGLTAAFVRHGITTEIAK